MSRRYTEEQHDFLRAYIPGHTNRNTAEAFNAVFPEVGITEEKVKCYAANHKIPNGCIRGIEKNLPTELWPKEAQDFLREHYHELTRAEALERLNELTGRAYTKKQLSAYTKNHRLKSVFDGRYKTGNKPAYCFKKGEHASRGTEFKSGHTPHNHLPVGSEVVTTDGYRALKVGEPNKWEFIHRRTWEAEHGEIPKGGMIIFLDGDKLNCSIENLALITRAEHAMMNKNGCRTEYPELTRANLLISKIRIAAKRRKDES